jgi:hypothetical protein
MPGSLPARRGGPFLSSADQAGRRPLRRSGLRSFWRQRPTAKGGRFSAPPRRGTVKACCRARASEREENGLTWNGSTPASGWGAQPIVCIAVGRKGWFECRGFSLDTVSSLSLLQQPRRLRPMSIKAKQSPNVGARAAISWNLLSKVRRIRHRHLHPSQGGQISTRTSSHFSYSNRIRTCQG